MALHLALFETECWGDLEMAHSEQLEILETVLSYFIAVFTLPPDSLMSHFRL